MGPSNTLFRAIGLMSGTSIDGIDVALLETDGQSFVRPLGFADFPYEAAFRERLRGCFGKKVADVDVERELTERHAEAVRLFLEKNKLRAQDIDLIGFHGQTIWHAPKERETVQIGDGALLAKLTDIDVVNDFRSADVKAGGQGAPLVPLYHRALAAKLEKPVAIINIGGVSNITWIGGDGDDEILAFDMGPGNALIDDWVLRHTGKPFDKDGELAASGVVHEAVVARFLAHPFFAQKPPKSLDRDVFLEFVPEGLSAADGAATLTMMTAAAIAAGMTKEKCKVYLTGGGRHNKTLVRWIGEKTGAEVGSVDELGWNGDAMEAEAFAYLAVRSKLGLPISLPRTTGVVEPMKGGKYYPAIAI